MRLAVFLCSMLLFAVNSIAADSKKIKPSAKESRTIKEAHKQSNEELCNHKAKEYHSAVFGNSSTSKADKNTTYGYISHYNKKRSTCYIHMWSKDADGIAKNLEDVYEKTNIASMFLHHKAKEPSWCVVEDIRCISVPIYERLIKPYMTQ